jgi:myosin heavy subunit
MKTLKFGNHAEEIFRCLAAVLHIGNIKLKAVEELVEVENKDGTVLTNCAKTTIPIILLSCSTRRIPLESEW